MKRRSSILTLILTAGFAGAAGAQQQQPQASDSVPKAYRPPPGMCRIWLDRVPAKQQPASTDCPTAVRNKPANGTVLFGDDYVEKKKDQKPDEQQAPFLKKFTDDKRKP